MAPYIGARSPSGRSPSGRSIPRLSSQRLIFAERGLERIAVEVKSFLKASAITDFYGALGQFLTYRLALGREDPERVLYLAVPEDPYKTFFRSDFIQIAIEEFQLLLIVDESYSIVTPPPNVTGSLHRGHLQTSHLVRSFVTKDH